MRINKICPLYFQARISPITMKKFEYNLSNGKKGINELYYKNNILIMQKNIILNRLGEIIKITITKIIKHMAENKIEI